jgi:hypothetical protein
VAAEFIPFFRRLVDGEETDIHHALKLFEAFYDFVTRKLLFDGKYLLIAMHFFAYLGNLNFFHEVTICTEKIFSLFYGTGYCVGGELSVHTIAYFLLNPEDHPYWARFEFSGDEEARRKFDRRLEWTARYIVYCLESLLPPESTFSPSPPLSTSPFPFSSCFVDDFFSYLEGPL